MIDVMYSVDMVRLKTRVPKDYMKRYVERNLDINPGVIYWEKTAFKSYRHNWQVKQQAVMGGEYSYWIGYQHNSENDVKNANLVIEYNPNKCPIDGLLEYILNEFFANLKTEIVSLDIAMDFEINIRDLLIDKFRKQGFKMFSNGGDDVTYYIGKGDGRTKIYNKARELGIEGDLTRYEVSKDIRQTIGSVLNPEYRFEGNILPIGYLTSTPTDKTLQGLLWAVKNGYPMDSLTRRKRESIRSYIDDNSELKFDNKKISQAIRSYFQGYKDILQFR